MSFRAGDKELFNTTSWKVPRPTENQHQLSTQYHVIRPLFENWIQYMQHRVEEQLMRLQGCVTCQKSLLLL